MRREGLLILPPTPMILPPTMVEDMPESPGGLSIGSVCPLAGVVPGVVEVCPPDAVLAGAPGAVEDCCEPKPPGCAAVVPSALAGVPKPLELGSSTLGDCGLRLPKSWPLGPT